MHVRCRVASLPAACLKVPLPNPVERAALEARVVTDPLAATYLAELAAFKQEMAALPKCTHGGNPGRDGSEAPLAEGEAM